MEKQSVFRARWVFPVCGPPMANGYVTVRAGRLVEVGPATEAGEVEDLGDAAILPALINAHTHLEFSGINQPLQPEVASFAGWIEAVIDYRQGKPKNTADHSADWRAVATRAGLQQCSQHHVAAAGEVATLPWNPELWSSLPLQGVVFLELLGLNPARRPELLEAARRHLETGRSLASTWTAGLSPHAPYTIGLETLQDIVALSQSYRAPLAMHVAETMDELELLAAGSGPLVELLRRREAWFPAAVPRGVRPWEYLQVLRHATRALVIHGNYLTDSEIEFLGQHRTQMQVVYCPRTHAYFGHQRYPLPELLQAGIRVALGTDSRASNPDLSLWEELRFAAHRHANVDPAELLRMATLHGAAALGLEQQFGSLEPGKRGELAIVQLAHPAAQDPYEALLD